MHLAQVRRVRKRLDRESVEQVFDGIKRYWSDSRRRHFRYEHEQLSFTLSGHSCVTVVRKCLKARKIPGHRRLAWWPGVCWSFTQFFG